MLHEEQIITRLREHFPQYIGDDAAVLQNPHRKALVITQDLLIEAVHFERRYTPAQDLAIKALAVNLSDLAAMGAFSKYVLLSIAIPKSAETYATSFLEAFAQACKDEGVTLIGGDTSASETDLLINVTALGEAENQKIKHRNCARSGDLICLIGNLGWAHLGFKALETNRSGFEVYKKAFLRPKALRKEGLWLASQEAVGAMMDVSDGLYIDLSRMAQESQQAIEINLDALQADESFLQASKDLKLEARQVMLEGGEDYGLLFSVRPKAFFELAKAFTATFSYPPLCLAKVVSGSGIHCIEKGQSKELKVKVFSHFNEL